MKSIIEEVRKRTVIKEKEIVINETFYIINKNGEFGVCDGCKTDSNEVYKFYTDECKICIRYIRELTDNYKK